MDVVYSLEVWVPDGERWRWSAIGAYPTLDMAVAVGEGFLSVKPYRVRRVTHLPIPLLCGLPYAFEGIVFREDAEEVAEYWRSASCRGASQKRVLKFLELHESHILRVRAGLDEVAAGYDGPSVVCPHHRVLRRQTGEGVDVRAEVLRYRRAGVAGLQRLVLIRFELLSELQHVHVAIVYDFPLEVGTLVAVDENLATREINHAHASIRTARSTSVPMRHSPR